MKSIHDYGTDGEEIIKNKMGRKTPNRKKETDNYERQKENIYYLG